MLEASRLGLTDVELNALLTVADNLRAGKYIHLQAEPSEAKELGYLENATSRSKFFNMNEAFCPLDDRCGSAACIGGWMAYAMGLRGKDAAQYVHDTMTFDEVKMKSCAKPIRDLFFPPVECGANWEKITPRMAADAIDNFVKYGTPKWESVLGWDEIVYDDDYDVGDDYDDDEGYY